MCEREGVTDFQITIAGHKIAVPFVQDNPGQYHLLIMTNSDTDLPPVRDYVKSLLWLQFDDVLWEFSNYVMPRREHVEQALEWAGDKNPILCSCHAGMSRSAAMAYVIACSRALHPRLALEVLTPIKHYPNELIVKYGADLLKNKSILDEYYKWINESVL